jgi:nitrate/nitrite-specific signal transduction histidine kinase
MSDDRNDRPSDAPADLGREREAFVRQFLRRGFEITESMLTENQALRDQLDRLRDENTRLRAQIASDDAIRDLIRRIDSLEVERRELLARSDELAESSRENERRSTEIEAELHDLANLYIASSHLHSTLSLKRVVRHLAELLQQLIGAERFAIYVIEPEGKRARAIHAEGLEASSVDVGEGTIGLVMAMRLPRIEDQPHPGGSLAAPVAIVPMLVKDTCVGAIAVASVFAQKERWAAVDHEFLGLLGSHGGSALIAATLYAERFPDGAAPDPRQALGKIHEQLARQRDADASTDTSDPSGATDR